MNAKDYTSEQLDVWPPKNIDLRKKRIRQEVKIAILTSTSMIQKRAQNRQLKNYQFKMIIQSQN